MGETSRVESAKSANQSAAASIEDTRRIDQQRQQDDGVKDDPPYGSADYALRTTQQTLIHLSAMADQKASIVLGSSFVMASIVLGDLAGASELDAARLLLMVTSTCAGILAALALMPSLSANKVTAKQPLFFASIAQMEIDDYQHVMSDMLGDREKIYDTIVHDLHASSRVLLRTKFRPLQASYAVLVVGMAATLVAVVVS